MRKFACASFLRTRHKLIATFLAGSRPPGLQDAKVLLQHLIKADIFIQSVLNKSERTKAAVREHAQVG